MSKQREEVVAPVRLFYSYAHEDERLCEKLEIHLSSLKREERISTWHDRDIVAGVDWAIAIDDALNTASIILLLISADFVASDYCYGIELRRALERHSRGEACVIPVLLRPVDWHHLPFAHLQSLPRNAQAVTIWSNQDEAFADVAQGIRRALDEMGRAESSIQLLSLLDRKSRINMLKRVRSIWVEGMLENSLHHAVLIEPDLHVGALANPFNLEVQETDVSARLLPAGTSLLQVYDEADGELLIQGEPGSGKTTLLLDLARTLLNRAERNEYYPLPVVFPLSSWAEKRQPLAKWLVEELRTKYYVPRQVAQTWITKGQLQPLLDGLDEVAEVYRSACVEAINTYHQQYADVPLVVCSRKTEYLAQPVRMQLRKAVIVQPLTGPQIMAYFQVTQDKLEAVQHAWQRDPILRELVTTPLMLSIFTLTYQNAQDDELPIEGPLEELQRQVFATYVKRMLRRHRSLQAREELQITHRLVFLATQMAQHHQYEFYLERLQPDWLSKRWSQWLYQFLALVPIGALVGLFLGLLIGDLAVFHIGLVAWGVIGLFIGIATMLFSISTAEAQSEEPILWSWHSLIKTKHLRNGLVIGLTIGLIGGFVNDLLLQYVGVSIEVIDVLHGGLIGALIGILSSVLIHGKTTEIHPTEQVIWSWSNFIRIKYLGVGLTIGLVLGLANLLIYGQLSGSLLESFSGLIYYALVALFFSTLLASLFGGLSSKVLDNNKHLKPNEGIRRSASNSILVGSVVGLCMGLVTALASEWGGNDLTETVTSGVVYGLISGLLSGFLFGGDACMRHIILRLLLWLTRSMPWNCERFLDHAAERILLRKVGGGYVFIHPLLRDYFEWLGTTSPPLDDLEQ